MRETNYYYENDYNCEEEICENANSNELTLKNLVQLGLFAVYGVTSCLTAMYCANHLPEVEAFLTNLFK